MSSTNCITSGIPFNTNSSGNKSLACNVRRRRPSETPSKFSPQIGKRCFLCRASVFDAEQALAPVLLRDSITMLLQLLMSAPIQLTTGEAAHGVHQRQMDVLVVDEFDTIVQIVFNVEFFKNLLAIVVEQTSEMRELMVSAKREGIVLVHRLNRMPTSTWIS